MLSMKVFQLLKPTCFQSAKKLPLLFSSPYLETLYFEKALKKKNLHNPQLSLPGSCSPLKCPSLPSLFAA